MNRLCRSLLAVLAVPLFATAFPFSSNAAESDEAKLPWWTEVQAQSDGMAEAVLWYEKDITSSVGFFGLATTDTSRYAATYAGPYWKPTEWLQLGVGIGRENQPNGVRRALFYSIDTEKFYSFGTVENGGSGPWYRAHAIYRLNERWGVGAMAEKDVGFGPRIEFNVNKNTILWTVALRGSVPNIELETRERKTTLMLGVSFSF